MTTTKNEITVGFMDTLRAVSHSGKDSIDVHWNEVAAHDLRHCGRCEVSDRLEGVTMCSTRTGRTNQGRGVEGSEAP